MFTRVDVESAEGPGVQIGSIIEAMAAAEAGKHGLAPLAVRREGFGVEVLAHNRLGEVSHVADQSLPI
jgi:hypothetical protein